MERHCLKNKKETGFLVVDWEVVCPVPNIVPKYPANRGPGVEGQRSDLNKIK
jgi:hypothetical protein